MYEVTKGIFAHEDEVKDFSDVINPHGMAMDQNKQVKVWWMCQKRAPIHAGGPTVAVVVVTVCEAGTWKLLQG